jgi:transposase
MIGKPTRKTDKEDARKIAQFIQRYPEDELPLAAMPSVEEEEPRSLVPMKGFLTRERIQAANRLHAVYVQAGITDLKKSSLAKAGCRPLRGVILQASWVVLRSKEGFFWGGAAADEVSPA